MPAETLSRYALAGLTLESGLRLPELGPAAPGARPDWTLRLSSSRPQLPPGGWFHYWNASNGRRWLSFGRDRGGYVLRFSQTATFRILLGCRTIECEGSALVPGKTIRHLFLNQVFPLALSRNDRFVLHASAVATPAGAIGFAGDSGVGKSTISAALSRAGSHLVADDALMIDPVRRQSSGPNRFVAVPMYGSVRLWPDSAGALFGTPDAHPPVASYTNKRLIAVHPVPARPAEPVPLRMLCLLGARTSMRRARRVSVRTLSPREAVIRLTSLSFQLDVRDPVELRDRFERLSAIVGSVPVVELTYPWRLDRLATTTDDLLATLDRLA